MFNENKDSLNKYEYFTDFKNIKYSEQGATITDYNSTNPNLFKEMRKQGIKEYKLVVIFINI